MVKNDKTFQTQAYLHIKSGLLAQQNVYLHDDETWIGSNPTCQIFLPDQSIQPWHALLTWREGSLFIQNYQQSVVMINRQKVFNILRIIDGDEITLGTFNATIHLAQNSVPQQNFPSMVQGGDNNDGDSQSPSLFMDWLSIDQIPTSPIGIAIAAQHHEISAATHYEVSTITHRRIFADMISTLPQKNISPIGVASTEITRYLCVAAHLNENFRMHVFQNIVGEEHRAMGNAYGIDIIPVVKCCFAAQKIAFVRDVILLVINLIAPFFIMLFLTQFSMSLRTLLTVPLSGTAPSSGYSFTINLLIFISPLVKSPLLMPALMVLFMTLIGSIAALSRPFVPSARRGMLYLIILLLLFPVTLLPLYILAWIVVTAEKLLAHFGPIATVLQKDKFEPNAIQQPIDPALQRKLRENFNMREGNVVVYDGESAFTGAGTRIGGWSFVLDVTRGKQEGEPPFAAPPFQVSEMYTFIAKQMEALDLLGLGEISCKDELYLNGQKIRADKRFIGSPFSHPYTQVASTLMKEFMEKPAHDIRYYKCIRVTLHQGDIIFSIFLKLVITGSNLFAGADYLLLPPLADEYRQVDTLASRSAIEKVFMLARESFFPTLSLIIRAPEKVIFWALRRPGTPRPRRSNRNPPLGYGATSSLRQFVSSSNYQTFFQRLDQEMCLKTVERQLLKSIVDFLDTKNIDTTDVKAPMATILNSSVIRTQGDSQ